MNKVKHLRVSRLLLPIILSISCIFLTNTNTSAQPVRLQTNLDTSHIQIGQWARYTITATHDTSTILNWPHFKDSLKELEIVNRSEIDTSIQGNVVNKRQTIAVTSFDSGYYVIPPVLFSYRTQSVEKQDTTKTEPNSLRVHGVAVDTSDAIRPIANIKEVPYTLAELWPYMITGLLVIGLIILGYYLFKRWRQQPHKEEPAITKPERPAHEVAFEKLQALENKKLWQSGKVKQYYIELSDIFREYLERRYRFNALEMTTGEIVDELQVHVTDIGLRQETREVLELADFVKFAKYVPNQDEHQQVMQKTQAIINRTKSKPQPTNQSQYEDQETPDVADANNDQEKQ